MARSPRPLELWIGEELHKAGIPSYRSTLLRQVVLMDPAFMGIGQEHSVKIGENHHKFVERYLPSMSYLRKNKQQFRRYLLETDPKEAKRFGKILAKGKNLRRQREEEQRRFIKKYAARYP